MKFIGYCRADFFGSDGKKVTGSNVYIATDIESRYGAGMSVERLYLTDGKCEREGIDLASLIGKEIKLYYNRYGKIDTIVPVDG